LFVTGVVLANASMDIAFHDTELNFTINMLNLTTSLNTEKNDNEIISKEYFKMF
jgi:hypothetical protein